MDSSYKQRKAEMLSKLRVTKILTQVIDLEENPENQLTLEEWAEVNDTMVKMLLKHKK
jgi:hypothetical protein